MATPKRREGPLSIEEMLDVMVGFLDDYQRRDFVRKLVLEEVRRSGIPGDVNGADALIDRALFLSDRIDEFEEEEES